MTATMRGMNIPLIDKGTAPNLQELRIIVEPDIIDHSIAWDSSKEQQQLYEEVLYMAVDPFLYSRSFEDLSERYPQGKYPFRVLLVLELLPYFDPDVELQVLHEDVVVNWEKKEIVEGWFPKGWSSEGTS